MSFARAILLEVGGMGMIREILFKQEYIQDSRRGTILIDEVNGVLWVWLGSDLNTKTRKQILPVAEKLLSEGYTSKMDGHAVGQNCSQIIVVDQKNLNDPSVHERHQKVLSLFSSNYIQDGRFVVQFELSADMVVTKREDPRDHALAGILIASILMDSPEIFIGRTSLGVYSIETSQGTVKFKIVNGNVQLEQGSIGLNDKIQRAFQENIKALK